MINELDFRIRKNGKPYSCCFCTKPELIENYDEAISDITQVWDCHHRLETHNSDGKRRVVELSRAELVALDMYYNRPPEELIFLTTKEHRFSHRKGRYLSDETKRKISEAGKGRHHSEETKKKMATARRGRYLSEKTCRKISEAHRGKGHPQAEETRKKISETMKGKGHPQLEKTRKRLSEFYKGKHWKLVDGKRIWY